jgi:hypothetical protein
MKLFCYMTKELSPPHWQMIMVFECSSLISAEVNAAALTKRAPAVMAMESGSFRMV